VHPYNIVQVNNQRNAAFILLGLLSLYMFRTRFVSIFRSNTQNYKGSHQCVSLRVGWSLVVPDGCGCFVQFSFCVLVQMYLLCLFGINETCRVIINQVKQKLHLVGYLPIRYYKEKNFFCGNIILTEADFLTQLFSKAGISVWQIVCFTIYCRFMSDVCVCVRARARAGRKKNNVVSNWEPPISENIHVTDPVRWLKSSIRKTVYTSTMNE